MREESGVREMLLDAARVEFLRCGYQKASLRIIAQNAGVSTGSVYFFFGSKEELFHAVVDEAAADIRSMLTQGTNQEYIGEATGEENDRAFILCLHRHPEESVILLEKAEGSPLEGFREEMILLLEKGFLMFFERAGGRRIDEPLIRLLVEQRVHMILGLIAQRFDLDTTMRYAVLLGTYSEAGFAGMMQHYHRLQKGSAG